MQHATHIEETPAGFVVHARIKFSGGFTLAGESVAEAVLDELRRQFSAENPRFCGLVGTEYDFPHRLGQPIAVGCDIAQVARRPYVHVHLLPMLGVSMAPGFAWWRPERVKHILLFAGDIRVRRRYTLAMLRRVAAHELGHALGVGDFYGGFAPYGLCRRRDAPVTAEVPADDIMRTPFLPGSFFTPNDLEMALLAQQTRAPQGHMPQGPWKGLREKSAALRL